MWLSVMGMVTSKHALDCEDDADIKCNEEQLALMTMTILPVRIAGTTQHVTTVVAIVWFR